MKQAIRIMATCVRDQKLPDGDEYKLFCDIVVIDGSIEKRKFFGYVDDAGDISPFILCPPIGGRKLGALQWDKDFSNNEDTTIYAANPKVGSYFTVFHHSDEEWTYQIKHIVLLT